MTRIALPGAGPVAAVLLASVLAAAALLAPAGDARAQQGRQDFFIPGQQQQRPPARPPAAPRPAPDRPAPDRPAADAAPDQDDAQAVQIPMPPVPELPPLPRGTSPPAAVIGVIGVPEVMRASVAAQEADRIISERREKLNEDAQKEQAGWREMQQALARDRTKLTPDQIRAKERELQERITKAQRQFGERNRIIQEAAQFAVNQVQASLIAVIRQVAESRGMNLVLHRQQVALNVNEFDITEQVAEELNKVLPKVEVPPEGVSPAIKPAPAAATPGAAPPRR